MKTSKKEYRLTALLNAQEKAVVDEWKKQNPHIKIGGEFARLIMAYVRGRLPEWRIHREAKPIRKGEVQ